MERELSTLGDIEWPEAAGCQERREGRAGRGMSQAAPGVQGHALSKGTAAASGIELTSVSLLPCKGLALWPTSSFLWEEGSSAQ